MLFTVTFYINSILMDKNQFDHFSVMEIAKVQNPFILYRHVNLLAGRRFSVLLPKQPEFLYD